MNKKKLKTTLIVLIILISLILCVNVVVYAAYALAATEVSYTKSDGTTTVSLKEALDELYTKVPTHEIGDEVTVGGEQFYVLEWDNNSDLVRLISKYNLNINGTEQYNASYTETNCQFSSTAYWVDGSTGSIFNLNDFIGFTSEDALGKAKSYGISKGSVASGLLSYEEANALLAKASSDTKIEKMLLGKENSGLFLEYWLGSGEETSWFGKEGVYGFDGAEGSIGYFLYSFESYRSAPGNNGIEICDILSFEGT